MSIKLVGITKPLVDGLETASDLISYCARVSNPPNQLNRNNSGLLRYCIKHKHFSIFEMVNIVMHIETTRDIGRQILRHRSFSFQEFSQRYSEPDSDAYIVREARLQDNDNKQNSLLCEDEVIKSQFLVSQKDVYHTAQRAYKAALKDGIAKEQARSLLPEGLTSTSMYMNGSLRSWITFCMVRCGVETQKEHRELAKAAVAILMDEFPFLKEVLRDCLDDNYSAES